MTPKNVLKDVVRGLLQAIKGSPYTKQTYMDLFKLLYGFASVGRRDGLLGLDKHVAEPEESAIFKASPRVSSNHHAQKFLCNSLSLVVDGNSDPGKLSATFEEEIKVIEREHHAAVSALVKTADALPGFGIVAAVLGIVVTMQAIDGPVEQIGHKVGAALVGTFLGILLSYGFFGPLAGRMEFLGEQESNFFRVMGSGVVAISEGNAPKEVVHRACRGVGSDCKPDAAELEAIFEHQEAA
jgi:chemotaxis protein MotA